MGLFPGSGNGFWINGVEPSGIVTEVRIRIKKDGDECPNALVP
jgi:hypothetical protein